MTRPERPKPSPRQDEITRLLRSGGAWQSRDIAKRLGIDRRRVNDTLHAMVLANRVYRTRVKPNCSLYSLTPLGIKEYEPPQRMQPSAPSISPIIKPKEIAYASSIFNWAKRDR